MIHTFLSILLLLLLLSSSSCVHAVPVPNRPPALHLDPAERDDEEDAISSPDATAPTTAPSPSTGLPLGAIIGIAAGGGVLVLVALVAVVCCVRRRRQVDGEDYQTFGEWRADRKLTSLDIPRRKAQAAQAAFQQLQQQREQQQDGPAPSGTETGAGPGGV